MVDGSIKAWTWLFKVFMVIFSDSRRRRFFPNLGGFSPSPGKSHFDSIYHSNHPIHYFFVSHQSFPEENKILLSVVNGSIHNISRFFFSENDLSGLSRKNGSVLFIGIQLSIPRIDYGHLFGLPSGGRFSR